MQDRWVQYRSANDIKRIVRGLLEQAGFAGRRHFNVVQLFNWLAANLKGGIELPQYSPEGGEPSAYVSFRPNLALYIDQEILNLANIGDPRARYILAHEIGHIVMHNYDELAFSNVGENLLKAPPAERSAENQANIFAHFILVPDEALQGNRSIEDIAAEISVERFVIETIQAYDSRRGEFRFLAKSEYVGDSCGSCGNFTLVRVGTCLKCNTCGSTTGCS